MMNPKRRVSVLVFICFILMHGAILFVKGGHLEAITALNIIENTHTDMCFGSAANLDLTLDFTLWNEYTNLAIYDANYMTTLIYQNKGSLESMSDLKFFNLARNVVITGSPKVFSSGLAFEPGVFSRYKEFAPYAYYKNGVIRLFDLSLSYVYQTSVDAEWYYNLKSRNWDNASSIISERHQRSVNNLIKKYIFFTCRSAIGLCTNFFAFRPFSIKCKICGLSQTLTLFYKRIQCF